MRDMKQQREAAVALSLKGARRAVGSEHPIDPTQPEAHETRESLGTSQKGQRDRERTGRAPFLLGDG